MKSLPRISLLVAIAASLLSAASLRAATIASDNAGNYGTDYNGQNLGTGFDSFGLNANPSSTSSNGTFVGDSTANANGSLGINTSGKSFGLYSNSGSAVITRYFTAGGGNGSINLASGQAFSIALDNGYINNGSSAGLRLVNSSGASEVSFQFTGGNSNYTYAVGTGSQVTTSIGYTGGGLTLGLAEGDNNSFTLTITSNTGATATYTGTAPDGIAGFQVFNNAAGSGANYDLYFNSMSVTGVPEVSTWLMGFGCLGAFAVMRRSRRSLSA